MIIFPNNCMLVCGIATTERPPDSLMGGRKRTDAIFNSIYLLSDWPRVIT